MTPCEDWSGGARHAPGRSTVPVKVEEIEYEMPSSMVSGSQSSFVLVADGAGLGAGRPGSDQGFFLPTHLRTTHLRISRAGPASRPGRADSCVATRAGARRGAVA